jgi:hypothetical protein
VIRLDGLVETGKAATQLPATYELVIGNRVELLPVRAAGRDAGHLSQRITEHTVEEAEHRLGDRALRRADAGARSPYALACAALLPDYDGWHVPGDNVFGEIFTWLRG